MIQIPLPSDVWDNLEEWADPAPPPPPGTAPVAPHEAVGRLTELLGPDSEERPGQRDYTALAAEAFSPRDVVGEPKLVLAEAGTGTGKTLGYIAPASVWAARNQGTDPGYDYIAIRPVVPEKERALFVSAVTLQPLEPGANSE